MEIKIILYIKIVYKQYWFYLQNVYKNDIIYEEMMSMK